MRCGHNQELCQECVTRLREFLSGETFHDDNRLELCDLSVLEVIRILREQEGENWIHSMTVMMVPGRDAPVKWGHFGFGLHVRNWMRQNGFGERELGVVGSLDDVYVSFLEEAAEVES